MRGKADSRLAADDEQREEPEKVWKVSGDRDVSRFAAETIADPLRRIIGLKIPRRREFSQRVARVPHRLGRLLRAELAAVPYDAWLRAVRGGASGNALDACDARRRQWPPCVDLRGDSVAVMNQEQKHQSTLVP